MTTTTARALDPELKLHHARFEPCAITPAQEKAWLETRTAFLFASPAFAHVLYTMMNPRGTEHIATFTRGIPIAATDGINLFLNPDTFFDYDLYERVFIMAHEVAHCIFNHCALGHAFHRRGKVTFTDGGSAPYDPRLMNVAMDLVINDMLIHATDGNGVPTCGTYNKNWLHDTSLGTQNDSPVDVYQRLFKKCEENGGGEGEAEGQGQPSPGQGGMPNGEGFDEHLAPGEGDGQDAAQAEQGRSETEWRTAVAAGLATARVQGKLPANIERAFGEFLEPKVSWREHIETLMARRLGSGGYDWRRADRRLIARHDPVFAPGRSGHGAGTVVVGVDTSGSIDKPTLDMFFAEMAGILEDVRPRNLVVIWCDASVGRVDELDDVGDLRVVRAKGAPGGGGTDLREIFNEVDRMDLSPDALVVLTDGLTPFPARAPAYPTVWGSIYAKPEVYPFGDVVMVPKVAA